MSIKKVTVNLPEDQINYLQQIAKSENISFTDALRRAINSEKFFIEQKNANRTVLVEDSNGHIYTVIRK